VELINAVMELDIITRNDLEDFRVRMLADIKELIEMRSGISPKPWLKGSEVRKLLGISAGTLQNLRVTGKLKSSKVGGVHFYRFQDIEKMIDSFLK
jgi:hypothetical protein